MAKINWRICVLNQVRQQATSLLLFVPAPLQIERNERGVLVHAGSRNDIHQLTENVPTHRGTVTNYLDFEFLRVIFWCVVVCDDVSQLYFFEEGYGRAYINRSNFWLLLWFVLFLLLFKIKFFVGTTVWNIPCSIIDQFCSTPLFSDWKRGRAISFCGICKGNYRGFWTF